MRLDSLKHLVKAVGSMTEGDRIIVFGSASILASYPELGELEGSPLLTTYDADLIPYPFEEELGLMLDESFGEDRIFHKRFGYHADIVRPKVTETFPKGWEERLVPLDGEETAMCLDPYDMGATKCVVGREKDRAQLDYLLKNDYLEMNELQNRVLGIEMSGVILARSNRFIESLLY